jgi:transcription-repair coupling factor (superfamily II helicase)
MKLLGHSIAEVLKEVEKREGRLNCTGLSGSERAYLLSSLHAKHQVPLFVICTTNKEALRLARDTHFFSGKKELPLSTFPSYDISPFRHLSCHPETACSRIGALYKLITAAKPPVLITSVGALLQKLLPKGALSEYADYLLPGEETPREPLIEKLLEGGYQETALVEEAGDFAVRGALIDLFPPLFSDPVRIEFFGDTVESIRTFSPQDQRTLKPLPECILLPASETVLAASELDGIVSRVRRQGQLLEMPGMRIEKIVERLRGREQFPGISGLMSLIYAPPGILFDYLPPGTLTVLVDPGGIERLAGETEETVTKNYLAASRDSHMCVEPEALYLTWPQVQARISSGPSLALKVAPVSSGNGASLHFSVQKNDLLAQELKTRKDSENLLEPLIDWTRKALESGLVPFFPCSTPKQAERLKGLLTPYGMNLRFVDAFPEEPLTDKVPTLCLGELSSGFVWPAESLALIAEQEIFGPKLRRRISKARPRTEWIALEDLRAGDLVVHTEHGIGRYQGLVKLHMEGLTNDFLVIEYCDGDKLYVPVDRMNWIQKYAGVDGITPRLDKMGGKSWERAKERVKKSIRKMAGELLKLYAWRKMQKGHPFSPHDKYLKDFADAFEYTETPDQQRAVEDVMGDMESPIPMDRLICGDVGYGKTEIALRAAFKAVWDNKQVAFLVPTTVLAEQHSQTFADRFKPYPVEIETLSRFRSLGEQRAVVERLRDGKVDIVIGTHRLLQKDIAFKDLGLLIIDEEQRFGVAHKERLKQLRRSVDVLALTATPIPRTLHMSMMGIRDLSVISTPPEYRYAIKTYISPFDDTVLAEAIHKELQRGGQMFFVHNNIRTIWAMARRIQGLLPNLRIGVAHGRLEDETLEEVMLQFVHQEIDLLLCTTIIESGLDFPSANTIFINRADKFGLSQIYQLRGRVGRGDEQAYAYLFIPHESALTRDAQKRLKVLMDHSDLGSGFQIAMSDLQIRGGGTILGPTQSGHIASVGYDMYMNLMEGAMKELKGEPVEPKLEPEIVLERSAYIPEDYVSHIDQRLSAYRRLAKVSKQSELEDVRKELRDRFGPVPAETEALFQKVSLKLMCYHVGVSRLEVGPQFAALTFVEETPVRPEKITELIEKDPGRFQFKPHGVLQARLCALADCDALECAKNLLQQLA